MSNVSPSGPNQAPGSTPALGNTLSRPVGKNYLDPRADAIDFTFYVTHLAAIAPAQSLPSQINIDAGTDFYWVATTLQADIGGVDQQEATVEVPLVTCVITDTGSQRQLMNAPVPISCIAGPGERPYRLILPRLFRANSIITFNWTSYEATVTYQLYLVLHGFRLPPNAPFNL
jgi:hypothetical protein